jgi:hypothetical protein
MSTKIRFSNPHNLPHHRPTLSHYSHLLAHNTSLALPNAARISPTSALTLSFLPLLPSNPNSSSRSIVSSPSSARSNPAITSHRPARGAGNHSARHSGHVWLQGWPAFTWRSMQLRPKTWVQAPRLVTCTAYSVVGSGCVGCRYAGDGVSLDGGSSILKVGGRTTKSLLRESEIGIL